MNNYYLKRKSDLQEQAKGYQKDFENLALSWWDIVGVSDYFAKLGKRYGLIKEFKREGII